MTISVYIETRDSAPGHLVKFSKAKLSQGIEKILDELVLVGRATLWVKKQQIHIEIERKKYKVFFIKNDGCDIQILTRDKLVKMINEMMGVK